MVLAIQMVLLIQAGFRDGDCDIYNGVWLCQALQRCAACYSDLAGRMEWERRWPLHSNNTADQVLITIIITRQYRLGVCNASFCLPGSFTLRVLTAPKLTWSQSLDGSAHRPGGKRGHVTIDPHVGIRSKRMVQPWYYMSQAGFVCRQTRKCQQNHTMLEMPRHAWYAAAWAGSTCRALHHSHLICMHRTSGKQVS